jgi:hypothetical protein
MRAFRRLLDLCRQDGCDGVGPVPEISLASLQKLARLDGGPIDTPAPAKTTRLSSRRASRMRSSNSMVPSFVIVLPHLLFACSGVEVLYLRDTKPGLLLWTKSNVPNTCAAFRVWRHPHLNPLLRILGRQVLGHMEFGVPPLYAMAVPVLSKALGSENAAPPSCP